MYPKFTPFIPNSQGGVAEGSGSSDPGSSSLSISKQLNKGSSSCESPEQKKYFPGSLKKSAQTCYESVLRLLNIYGQSIGHAGLLTITTSDLCQDPKEFNRRFNSFNTNWLSRDSRFGNWVLSIEPTKKGYVHVHLVILISEDIKTGLDFEQCFPKKGRGNYKTASPFLRNLWKDLRIALKSYGFGRHELAPLKGTAESAARYVSKYVTKSFYEKPDNWKGVRLWRASRGWSRPSVKRSWVGGNSQKWRQDLGAFSYLYGFEDFYQIKDALGENWVWHYKDVIDIAKDLVLENSGQPYVSDRQLQQIEKLKKAKGVRDGFRTAFNGWSLEKRITYIRRQRIFETRDKRAKGYRQRSKQEISRLLCDYSANGIKLSYDSPDESGNNGTGWVVQYPPGSSPSKDVRISNQQHANHLRKMFSDLGFTTEI